MQTGSTGEGYDAQNGKFMIFAGLICLTAFLVVATLLPLLRCEAWWIRGFDFPRLELTTIALGLGTTALILLDQSQPQTWLLVAVVLACFVYQGWWILPYTLVYPHEVKSSVGLDPNNRIRIMTANVLTPNRNADQLLQLVGAYRPDVLVTLESNIWWQQRLDVLESTYPYSVKCPLENLYGMHVYSKFPLENAEIQYLVEPDVPSIHAEVVLPSKQPVMIHFLHPAPPSPTENEQSTERDVELLLVAKRVARTDAPVIVTGDLNDVAWSATTRLFRKISGLLDPRVGRGMFNTFHADYWFIRWPLDHLFHSRHFTLSSIRRLSKFGSDHFPVLVELFYEPQRGTRQEGLEANGSDHAEAEEKIRRKDGIAGKASP